MAEDQIAALKAHFAVVKQSPPEKIEEDFYNFMVKAKEQVGEQHYVMANFAYEYANLFLKKLQSNLDIFNANALPEAEQEESNNLVDYDAGDTSEQNQEPQVQVVEQNAQEQSEKNNQAANPQQPEIIEDGALNGQQPQEDIDQGDTCLINFLLAQKIYNKELQKINGGESSVEIDEVLNGLKRVYTRLGDFFMFEQNYEKSNEYYQKVIDQQSTRQGFQSNKFLSQIYLLMGTNLLNQDKENCQVKTISLYVRAVHTLVSYLNVNLQYNTSQFQLPDQHQTTVNRFHYCLIAGDSEEVKETKEIICCILDKLEDCKQQLDSKATFLAEKEKIKNQNSKKEFKPVDQNTKVIHLGSFGNKNKKKMPQQIQIKPEPSQALKQKWEKNKTQQKIQKVQKNEDESRRTIPKSEEEKA